MPGQASRLNALEYAQSGDDSPKVPKLGGAVIRMTAAAALNIGDIVYLSANDTVNKSAVVGTFSNKLVGVVVGGKQTGNEAFHFSAAQIVAGKLAANANEEVLVCYSGVAYVVTDAATALGSIVASVLTAGNVHAAASLTLNAGATAVTSSAANGAIIGGDSMGHVVGKLLESTAGAAAAALALIHIQ